MTSSNLVATHNDIGAFVLMKTVYGNHIMTLKRQEPSVKIFRTKPESNIVHTLETLESESNYSKAFVP